MREMLAEGGQSEKSLGSVKRFSMNRLVEISGSRFTQEMLDGLIAKTEAAVAAGGLSSETQWAQADDAAIRRTALVTPEKMEWEELRSHAAALRARPLSSPGRDLASAGLRRLVWLARVAA